MPFGKFYTLPESKEPENTRFYSFGKYLSERIFHHQFQGGFFKVRFTVADRFSMNSRSSKSAVKTKLKTKVRVRAKVAKVKKPVAASSAARETISSVKRDSSVKRGKQVFNKTEIHPRDGHPEVQKHHRVRRQSSASSPIVALVALIVTGIYGVFQQFNTDTQLSPSRPEHVQQIPAQVPAYSASPFTPAPTPSTPVAFQEEFKHLNGASLDQKIDYWSSYLERNLEARQNLESLVKGRHLPDSAPLIPAKYNCTTYVETVVALARSNAPEEFLKNLIAIRYRGGVPSFEGRNHFPEADWIPNNEKANILSDVTNAIASKTGVSPGVERKLIDREKWLIAQNSSYDRRTRSRALASARPSGPIPVQVDYIRVDDLERVLANIPSGTVVNLVHKDNVSHPVLIAHQGFLIRMPNGRLFLRHSSPNGLIRSTDLLTYISYYKRKVHRGWELLGVNINQII